MENLEITEAVIIAYLNGELSEREQIEVEEWCAKNEDNQAFFNETKEVWEITGSLSIKPVVVNNDHAWNKVKSEIEAGEKENVIALNGKTKGFWWSMAAAIVILLGMSYFLQNNDPETIAVVTKNDVLKDTLSDGTLVALNVNSSISYPESFDKERRIELKGEAFFDVERDETKPFIVDLPNDFEVQVLGTSFNVNANEADSITEVYVASGTVKVSTKTETVILEKGEMAALSKNTGRIQKSTPKSGKNAELFWMNEELRFDGESLDEVLEILKEIFKTDIQLTCKDKGSAPTISYHKKEGVEEILKVIAEVHRLNLVIQSNAFILECDD